MPKEVDIFGYSVIEHGEGEFGMRYSGITGQDAIEFLSKLKSGEILGAFYHPELGLIDLLWGRETVEQTKGYGLAKILQKHPEVIATLEFSIQNGRIIEELPGRCVLLCETHKQQSLVDYSLIIRVKNGF